MVKRALTSPPLSCLLKGTGGGPTGRRRQSVMISAAREPTPAPTAAAGPTVDTRSPFARLADLIRGVEPGKPAIDLGVGEPKHPVPDFVAPVMAAHIREF